MTNTSHKRGHAACQLLVVTLFALVEAHVLAQYGAAGGAVDALEPLLAQRHGLPSSSDKRAATGASVSAGSYTPSFGRPRCESMNTLAC